MVTAAMAITAKSMYFTKETRMTFGKPSFAFVLLMVTSVVGTSIKAAEVNYEFRSGVSYSDNIRRDVANEQDQTIAILGFKINAKGESLRFEGILSADVEYNDYLDDVFDETVFSSFNGLAILKFAPDIFHWIIEDKFGFLKRNPFGVDTPENRENINTFSTGPYFSIPMGGRTTIDFNGRYRVTNFEISDSDNTALTGTLSLVRSMTPNRFVSLNLSADRVEFDNAELYGAFDRQSAYLGFSSRISRGDLRITVGINELHDNGIVFSGTLASIKWSRNISNLSTVSVDYSQKLSDAGNFFYSFDSAGALPGTANDIVPIADPFENQTVSLAYTYSKNRTEFSMSAYARRDEYQSASDFDSENIGVTVKLSRKLGAGWGLGAAGRLSNRHFPISDRKDDYLDLIFNVDRRLTRIMSITFAYRYADRSSNSGDDYSESRYTLLIRFTPGI